MTRPRRPTDQEVRTLLSDLSARSSSEAPPAGFADAVMERIEAEPRRTRQRRVPRWALWPALAATAAGIALAGRLLPARSVPVGTDTPGATPRVSAPRTPEQEEFLALRDEAQILAEQIELLRLLASEPGPDPFGAAGGPFVRLGGTDRMDVFFDLGSFVEPPASAAPGPVVVPASTRRPRR